MQKVIVQRLPERLDILEAVGRFSKPLDPSDSKRFANLKVRIGTAFAWAWLVCLGGDRKSNYYATLGALVTSGMRLMAAEAPIPAEGRNTYWRGYHDLCCFQLAGFIGDTKMVADLAALATYAVDDTSSDSCEQAWSGVWKFSVLGDPERALAQLEIMYRTPKPINLRLPRQALLKAWIEKDWDAFGRALKKSYQQLWKAARKAKHVVSETDDIVEVDFQNLNIMVTGSWQEIGLSVYALACGIELPFDCLFFPTSVVDYSQLRCEGTTPI